MTTTVHQLIKQLQKLDPNKPIGLCGSTQMYLYEQKEVEGFTYYTLDYDSLILDEENSRTILLHDFQGVEQPTKKWATAIAKRIFEEPESLVEFAIEENDPTIAALLLKPDETPYSVAIMTKQLLANPHFIYQLIGTSIIEEGYFDDLN